ncbi:MAG: type I glutamate--ammonia ligase [Clostridiales bacterium]|nr:type I glutamate--ammonia ligase [Clostridiales bacterium]
MFKNYLEVQEFCKKNQIKLIDFKILDLAGRWHHLTITPRRFTSETIEHGIGFDGSSYGFLTVEKSDMVFKPDLTSYFIDPFAEIKTLVFMTKVYKLGDVHTRFESDPRFVCEKAEAYIKEKKIATRVMLGPEFEYYTFDSMHFSMKPESYGYKLDAKQAHWNSDTEDNNNGYIVGHHGGYHVDLPKDINFDMRNEMVLMLENLCVPVKYHHPEVGGPGQQEIELDFDNTLVMGDRTMLVKYVVKNVAASHGKTATFMPKPIFGEAGNGMHVHIQLFDGETPLFYEKGGYSDMSKIGLYAIGGILKHSASLMAFTNPSTNAFKRLVPGYEAPVSICFGTANRSSVIRIPGYATEPSEKRFEFRPSDATANPYLAFSALVMAAIDGIIEKIDPTDEGFGPYDINVFDLPEDQKHKIKGLPKNLYETISALETDSDYLLRGDVFTRELLDNQIKYLRKEAAAESTMPSPREFMAYYDL